MYQINQSNQFNVRMTMPSISTRLSLKNVTDPVQKMQKSHADINLNFANSLQSNSNSFFVRISKASLDQQKRIYKWRMNCSELFIGIASFKLQSEGNCYNPNLLYKVQLAISKSNFIPIKDLSLTKAVNILKSLLNGIQMLFQYFDPIIFTEKMIYLTEEGTTKIWIDERFYINPNNQLYHKNPKVVNVLQSLRSITDIIKLKCLKTKLSQKLFKKLQEVITISKTLSVIQNFQIEEKLFSAQVLKNSVSASTALNTSCSLQFSTSNTIKKRKVNDKQEKQKKQPKIRNIASHGFLQHKSMQIDPYLLKITSEKQIKTTHKSQYEKNQKQQNQRSVNGNSLLQVKSDKPAQSLVISQLFASNNSFGQQMTYQKKILENPEKQTKQQQKTQTNKLEIPKYQKPKQLNKKMENKKEHETQQPSIETILSKNGWNQKILSLFAGKNVKQSFSEGKQENMQLKGFQLKKLHTMGKQIRQSILPVEQQFDEC